MADDWFAEECLARCGHRDLGKARDGVDQQREVIEQGRLVRKTITIGDLRRTFVERVRLFGQAELEALCHEAGFHEDAIHGDCDGGAPRPDPRMIFFARRQ